MFISKCTDRSVSKLESQDVTFIENEFPRIGEVGGNIRFYELDNPLNSITSNMDVDTNIEFVRIFAYNRNGTPKDLVSLDELI